MTEKIKCQRGCSCFVIVMVVAVLIVCVLITYVLTACCHCTGVLIECILIECVLIAAPGTPLRPPKSAAHSCKPSNILEDTYRGK